MNLKRCYGCKTEKPLTDFGKNKTKPDGLQGKCKKCRNSYGKKWYQENAEIHAVRNKNSKTKNYGHIRLMIQEYLLTHPCIDCGNSDIEVLEFDHRDSTLKEFAIGAFRGKSWEKVELEINKCDVRCANCHRKKTRRQLGHWTFSDEESF